MSPVVETRIVAPEGFASRAVARSFWQLEEQRRRLTAATRGLGPDDLAWQHAPGMNTIGMLLAHLAHSEANLAQVGLLGEPMGHTHDVIGITEADHGMPLPPGGRPPEALAGRPLEWFDAMLANARAVTERAARLLGDADLDVVVQRPPRPDGTVRRFDRAWVFYHLVEHEAGHRAQIQLLRHLRGA